MRTPGFPGRQSHGSRHPFQNGLFQAFFNDKPGRQEQGPGPAHGQVVDRAVDGQVADVAAGEKKRSYHKGVGGKGVAGGFQG